MAPIDDIAVLTSENVRLTYTLAGMGSRVAAFLADTLIIVLMSIAVTVLFMTVGFSLSALGNEMTEGAVSLLGAIYIFVITFLYWGYYFFFEWINWGQTPGKQLLGIRVSMADGAPADIVACATRNVVRIVDLILASLGITFFIMIFTPRYQRLGDLAAGTVVVRRRRLTFEDIYEAARRSEEKAAEIMARASSRTGAELNIRINDTETALLRKFMERRESLPPDVRRKLAADLARRIRAKAPGASADSLGSEALIEAALANQSRRKA